MSEIFYNVTVNVSEDIHDGWLAWMQETHIPDVLDTGMFKRATLLRVHAFEQGGLTYAVQYVADSMQNYERYLKEYAPSLRTKTESLYGDQVHAFRTMLEVVQDFAPRKRK
jgi:hypothetical protein